MTVINIKSRLKRLEQKEVTPLNAWWFGVDIKKLTNRELLEYIEKLSKERIDIGKYKGKQLKDLSNEQLEEYRKELLAMKGIN